MTSHSPTELTFRVVPQYNEKPLKLFLRRHCEISAALMTALKKNERGITVNGAHARVVDIVRTGDTVVLTLPEDHSEIPPADLPCKVLYEDAHVIAYDKPPFMTVHPVRGHQGDTLANAAAAYAMKKGESYSFRAVNRLDRDTSGIVLAAKNSFAASLLPQSVEKTYIGVCEGEITQPGTINKPIRLKPGHTIERETGEGGEPAVTHYEPIKCVGGRTLVKFKLETGRTHQIRVHMASIGHPLEGDDMYSGKCSGDRSYTAAILSPEELKKAWEDYFSRTQSTKGEFVRQALHCAKITFIHPVTKEKITIISTLPFPVYTQSYK